MQLPYCLVRRILELLLDDSGDDGGSDTEAVKRTYPRRSWLVARRLNQCMRVDVEARALAHMDARTRANQGVFAGYAGWRLTSEAVAAAAASPPTRCYACGVMLDVENGAPTRPLTPLHWEVVVIERKRDHHRRTNPIRRVFHRHQDVPLCDSCVHSRTVTVPVARRSLMQAACSDQFDPCVVCTCEPLHELPSAYEQTIVLMDKRHRCCKRTVHMYCCKHVARSSIAEVLSPVTNRRTSVRFWKARAEGAKPTIV